MFARPDRIIVTQFSPPEGLSVIAAAELLGDSKRAVAAQLVDLAVRGLIGVRKLGRRREGFELRLRAVPVDDGTDLARDDLAVLTALFPSLRPGAVQALAPSTRRRIGERMRAAHRESVARLIATGLVRERTWFEKALVFWRKQPTVPTEAAHPVIDHLWGVHDYVAWAEADRLAFHQSPEGAEVRELDGVGLLHLHERLLPYAVLFGLEKEWRRELDIRYEEARASLGDAAHLVDGVEVALHLASAAADVVSIAADLHELASGVDVPDLGDAGDLGAAVDLGGAAEGLGAFLGGLGDFLGSLDV
ncbi:hypothetical protein H4J02_01030 [Protaetiibacter sp. SSC-01]|uniref:hypothetical protein n=1 Tax=Protaetiibacter sp. SSC-01 TaxID=2759943 RepID=UPI001657236B|nr:hypothetical protein [Protaetiibacter sp. SSC-01]QNO37661.1 hypothetical protein H4J02_01030 [Protaetiibacter sp. SSC-01]